MTVVRRVYISMPNDGVDEKLDEVKWGIVKRIAQNGYAPEIFIRTNPYNDDGLASGRDWTPQNVDEVARRCVGAAILGFTRWVFETDHGDVCLPTEYNHYEGAVANTLGLPSLAVLRDDFPMRGFFKGGHVFSFCPPDAGTDWLDSDAFKSPYKTWQTKIDKRHDVFLGYCSKAQNTAEAIMKVLENEGARVLDWREFPPGGSIIGQISEAAARCTAGVFLFSKDDELEGGENRLAPRDNVVLEAGFFAHAKGPERVLIVREEGAKMPADLGGNIFAPLADRTDITSIADDLRKFLEHRL
jgi:hypothetical protein